MAYLPLTRRIVVRQSNTPTEVPSTSTLNFGEIALNTYDGLAYMKYNNGGGDAIVEISGGIVGPVSVPYDITLAYVSAVPPAANNVITGMIASRTITLGAALVGSQALTTTASTTSASVFNIRKNGTVLGTITFAQNATAGTFSFESTTTINSGDVLDIEVSGTVATDIGFIYITLAGTTAITL